MAETGNVGPRTIIEGKQLGAMLIPLEAAEENSTYWWYTCKHLRPSGDCAIYETRPEMCSKYPYGHKCRYPGCTWDEAKSLPDELNEKVIKEAGLENA